MRDKRAPRNTTEDVRRDPLLTLAVSMGGGGIGRSIEEQERGGQGSFVTSDTLPTEGLAEFRAALEKAGGAVGEPVAGDAMFTYVTLPPGWTKRASDHAMWSYLHDEKGRERAAMFYKAAFYDRSARISGSLRFRVDGYSHDPETEIVVKVMDGKTVIFQTDPVPRPDRPYEVRQQRTEIAVAWLTEHYPDWRNAAAYWDEPAS